MVKPDYTLKDYVRWMGAFTFEEKPFCDSDALVLCDVVYFEIFNSGKSPEKTLRELILAAPIDDPTIVKCLGGGNKEHKEFIQAVSASRRFGEIRVKNYAETLDLEKSIQFAAINFSYNGIFNFIAFRGTDDTIAGWREDFMIAFSKTTAQKMALDYAAAGLTEGSVNYIGGHSKGGNLALYAASMLPDKLQDRLTHVYDLDGPGFCEEVFDIKALEKIKDKTTFIIPECSVIGKLFEPDLPDTKIVASCGKAIMQHELLSWGVTEYGLLTVPDNDPEAKNINRLIDEWLENVPQADREIFVNELFDALEKDGAKTMSDLMSNDFNGFEKILFRVAGVSETTKKTAAILPEMALFGDIPREIRDKGFLKFALTNRLLHALLLIAVGFLCVFVPEKLMNTVTIALFTGLTVLQIIITYRRLKENRWKFEAISERLHFCLILIILTLCVYVRRTMFMMGSIIFLIIVFMIALNSGLKAKNGSNPLHTRLLSLLECMAANIFGIIFLITPQESVFTFAVSIGSSLIIDGFLRILFEELESLHILPSSSG